MKTILLIVAAVLVASCAANSPRGIEPSDTGGTITQSVQFVGPMNDLFPEQRQIKSGRIERPIVFGNQRVQFPLTQAVQCNASKSECKHAVINTWLEFTVQPQPNQEFMVKGALHSEMGRSFSVETKTSSGYLQTESKTIPESVPLIGEITNDQPFQKTLKLREALELSGLAEVRVVVEFQ
jgi:hypothetical protein